MCALPSGHSFFRKKRMATANRQKNTFCAASAVRNDPLENFAFDIPQIRKNRTSEIFQRTAQKILGTISI